MEDAADRLQVEYVLPLKWYGDEDRADLAAYLRRISGWVDVTVVDGSAERLFAANRELWSSYGRQLAPEPWPGRNGKVAGVVTGVRHSRHEHVVIADDDVRWSRSQLQHAVGLLAGADLVRPQNVFDPLPWHARWDIGRTLLNRAVGADFPGTYALRRSTFLAMGGYDGDVLFENLELSRTVQAAGGREVIAGSIFVKRRPPSVRHFLSQRIRQAYDDFAQPYRLVIEAALLPALVAIGIRGLRTGRREWAARRLIAALGAVVSLAERGRRTDRGADVFPRTAALWAPLWLLERAVCVWLAIGYRIAGGVPYAGSRLRRAAHSRRQLRSRVLCARRLDASEVPA